MVNKRGGKKVVDENRVRKILWFKVDMKLLRDRYSVQGRVVRPDC